MWLKDNYKLILLTLGIVLVIDFVYLFMNKNMYSNIIDKNNIKLQYGLVAWLIIAFALTFFILSNNNLTQTQKIMYAFILGICVNGIYNFTNMTFFSNWNHQILLVDTLWGGILYAIVTFTVLYLRDTYKLF
jgi:uncharacterized membrane protein